jgi:hypothetical protein
MRTDPRRLELQCDARSRLGIHEAAELAQDCCVVGVQFRLVRNACDRIPQVLVGVA